MKSLSYMMAALLLAACNPAPTSNSIQSDMQERMLMEATRQAPLPSIQNFRERKILKMIYEMRDQENLSTFTYVVAEQTGKVVFLGNSIGFAIPAAAQFTSPMHFELAPYNAGGNYVSMPQADPNGLFSPTSAEGSWILMKDPHSDRVAPVYAEPRLIVSPFPLQ